MFLVDATKNIIPQKEIAFHICIWDAFHSQGLTMSTIFPVGILIYPILGCTGHHISLFATMPLQAHRSVCPLSNISSLGWYINTYHVTCLYLCSLHFGSILWQDILFYHCRKEKHLSHIAYIWFQNLVSPSTLYILTSWETDTHPQALIPVSRHHWGLTREGLRSPHLPSMMQRISPLGALSWSGEDGGLGQLGWAFALW